MSPLSILFATSEMAPWVKTGGLGDVGYSGLVEAFFSYHSASRVEDGGLRVANQPTDAPAQSQELAARDGQGTLEPADLARNVPGLEHDLVDGG